MKRPIGLLLVVGIPAGLASGVAVAVEPPAPLPLSIGRGVTAQRLAPTTLSLATLPHATATPSGAFLSSYLAPQMARRLAPLGEWFASPGLEREPATSVSRLEMQENAERQAWKATRKAVRSYLGDRFESELTVTAGLPSGSTSTKGGTRVSFGIASLRPRVLVERAAGGGSVRLGVDVTGDVTVDWRPLASETRLGASYDAASRRLGLNLAGRF
jgi:hypothetical protein